MYRDMTRGSITRGLLLFALPMAAGDPCGAGLCAGGAWRTPWDTATTSSGAERCSLGRETADSRNQKERCVTYELHPIC